MPIERSGAPAGTPAPLVRDWFVRMLAAAISLVLIATAIAHFRDGLAVESAYLETEYMNMGSPLSHEAYVHAAKALARAAPQDGDASIAESEALANAGANAGDVMALARKGLAWSPSSSHGWTLLAEQRAPADRRGAADDLSVSLSLAPNDYWLVGRNELLAGALWDILPQDSRALAALAVPNLWNVEQLREYIPPFLTTLAGPSLMKDGLRYHPERLAEMNDWLATLKPKKIQAVTSREHQP